MILGFKNLVLILYFAFSDKINSKPKKCTFLEIDDIGKNRRF